MTIAGSEIRAWGATAMGGQLEPVTIERRALRADDVSIRTEYAGICHSDIHTIAGDWGERKLPLVPGHEIVGIVDAVGPGVTKYKVGDRVGVGVFCNSCCECDPCNSGDESYCEVAPVGTYGIDDRYTGDYTQGGYSQGIVVRERFVARIPEGLDPAQAAPLMCAGVTTFSPLKHWGAGPGKRVAIVGVGGLGHVAIKIAAAMGAEVTALSHSTSKREDALRFGATAHYSTADGLPEELTHYFDLIINTVSVDLDVDAYMGLLRFNGTFVQLGLPSAPMQAKARSFTQRRTSLAGSLVGGMRETQEMLDFCAEHGIGAEIELVDADYVNTAYERTVASDVRYRFVIDAATI